jgi:hypothetical protein
LAEGEEIVKQPAANCKIVNAPNRFEVLRANDEAMGEDEGWNERASSNGQVTWSSGWSKSRVAGYSSRPRSPPMNTVAVINVDHV